MPARRFSARKNGNGFLPRHHLGLDPDLEGARAFEHPSVREWWRWLREDYAPRSPVALITPCSSVKPYTRSPTSRKIRGLLRRLGLWDPGADRPAGIEWLYLSDLLLLVPYQRAEEYPACCYEVPPDLVLGDARLYGLVSEALAVAVEALASRGLGRVLLFLPRKHLRLWEEARGRARRWPEETRVKYTLFSTKQLGEALAGLRPG